MKIYNVSVESDYLEEFGTYCGCSTTKEGAEALIKQAIEKIKKVKDFEDVDASNFQISEEETDVLSDLVDDAISYI